MNKEVVKVNLIRFLIFIFLIAMPNLFGIESFLYLMVMIYCEFHLAC